MGAWCPSWGLRVLAVLSALGALGCNQVDVAGTLAESSELELDGGMPPNPGRGRGDADVETGPAARVVAPTCAEARAVFSRAICTCRQLESFGDLRSASLVDGAARADVAVGGTLRVASFVGPVSGDLTVAGNGLSLLAGVDGRVSGALRVNSELRVRGRTRIDGSAWLRGMLMGDGVLETAGDLYQPRPQVSLSEMGTPLVTYDGQLVVGEVSVADPCACDEGALLGIEALVAQAGSATTVALGDLPEDHSVDLPAGRVFAEQISAAGDLTLRAAGSVVLLVAGDLNVRGALRADLPEGAELELWIAGDMAVRGPVALAPRERPGAGRMFVLGRTLGEAGPAGAPGREVIEDLPTPAQRDNPDAEWVVSLYAPRFDLSLGSDTDVYGSLFVRSLLSVGDVRMHHALSGGMGCDAP